MFGAYEKCQTDGVENESCTNWQVSFLMFILQTSLIEKYNKIMLILLYLKRDIDSGKAKLLGAS